MLAAVASRHNWPERGLHSQRVLHFSVLLGGMPWRIVVSLKDVSKCIRETRHDVSTIAYHYRAVCPSWPSKLARLASCSTLSAGELC